MVRILGRTGLGSLLLPVALALVLLAAGCGGGAEKTAGAPLRRGAATSLEDEGGGPGPEAAPRTPTGSPAGPGMPMPTLAGLPSAVQPAAAPAPQAPLTGEIPEQFAPVPPDVAAQRIEAFQMLYGPFERQQVKASDGSTLEYAVFSQTVCPWDGTYHRPGTAKCRTCGRDLPKATVRVRLPLSFITGVTTVGGMENLYRIFPIYPGPPVRRVRPRPRPTRTATRARRPTRSVPTEWPSPVL